MNKYTPKKLNSFKQQRDVNKVQKHRYINIAREHKQMEKMKSVFAKDRQIGGEIGRESAFGQIIHTQRLTFGVYIKSIAPKMNVDASGTRGPSEYF